MSALQHFKVVNRDYGFMMPVRTLDFIQAEKPRSVMNLALQELHAEIEKDMPGALVKIDMISTSTRAGYTYIGYRIKVSDPDVR